MDFEIQEDSWKYLQPTIPVNYIRMAILIKHTPWYHKKSIHSFLVPLSPAIRIPTSNTHTFSSILLPRPPGEAIYSPATYKIPFILIPSSILTSPFHLSSLPYYPDLDISFF